MPTKVVIAALTDFRPEDDALFRRAGDLLEQAVNSPSFRQRVIDTRFRETRFRRRGGRRVNKTSEQVAGIILDGLERDTSADHEIDISIRKDPTVLYDTVGMTTPGKPSFRTGAWFVDLCVREDDAISAARHMIHEWLHVAGFVHVRNSGYRPDVPYLVGKLVRTILRELAASGSLKNGVAEAESTEAAKALETGHDDVEAEGAR